MPVTLRDVVDDPELRLTAHADPEALRRSVTWVHTSELRDPTPFLEGGELLLTTGLDLDDDRRTCQAYVDRLAAAGVAGLGFGVEIIHPEVPPALARAASAADVALVEVPREVPFIAISKAVSRGLAAEENAELRRISRSQRELARAAGGGRGLAALIGKLATQLQGWALLLDPAGAVVHASPRSAAGGHDELGREIERLRATRGPAASSFAAGGEEIILQGLGARARGFLAVGNRRPWTTTDHHVINSAASLLTLALEQQHEVDDARRRVRTGTFELLIRGGDQIALPALRELLTAVPAEPLRVFRVAGPGGTEPVLDAVDTDLSGLAGNPFTAEYDGAVVAVVESGSAAADRLVSLPGRHAGTCVGVSQPCGLDAVAEGHRQAADAARNATDGAMFFSDLAGQGLLGLLPRSDARAFADSLLAPIVTHDAGRRRTAALEASLREWLAQHGQWDPAASRLGVHRHTLRNRIRKIEGLLGRSLDDPGLRAELWMALQALDGDD